MDPQVAVGVADLGLEMIAASRIDHWPTSLSIAGFKVDRRACISEIGKHKISLLDF